MVFELHLADERLPTALLHPIPVGYILYSKGVQLAAHEADALVGRLDVGVEIGDPRERLSTPFPCANHRLPVLHRGARVVHVNMSRQVRLAAALGIAEHAVDVLSPHVRLELEERCESDTLCASITVLRRALVTPELQLAMLPLDVASEGRRRVKSAATSRLRTDVSRHFEMGHPYMPLQGLMFPEGLVALFVSPASEALGSLVDGSVAAQPRGGDEGLAASGLFADVLFLVGVRALDVLCEVFLLEVGLVAAVIMAAEGTIASMRSEMGG